MLEIIYVLIGAAVTWFVAYKYYKRAGDDLRQEAEKLRQLNILMIRAMEEAGLAKFNRDEKGNPVGLVFEEFVQN